MEFNDNKPIYRQIIDYCYIQILTGGWDTGPRIPSVREMSIVLQVNTRTILKALEHIQASGIIVPRRGMGFSLAPDAKERVKAERRKEFFSSTLPDIVSEMRLLGMKREEIEEYLDPIS